VETNGASSLNGAPSEIIKTEKETKEVNVQIMEKVAEAEKKRRRKIRSGSRSRS